MFGVDVAPLLHQPAYLPLEVPELAEPHGDLGPPDPEEFPGVDTRCFTLGPDGQDAGYLRQGESRVLGSLQEPETPHRIVVVVAVPRGGSTGRRENALVFVEPNGANSDAGGVRELADLHPRRIGVDPPPHWRPYGGGMDVTLLYFDDCPNWRTTKGHLTTLAGELGFTLRTRRVATPEEAENLQFRGSPTVLVDGWDPFADPDAPVGLSCRLYRNAVGFTGSPTIEELRSAIRSGGGTR